MENPEKSSNKIFLQGKTTLLEESSESDIKCIKRNDSCLNNERINFKLSLRKKKIDEIVNLHRKSDFLDTRLIDDSDILLLFEQEEIDSILSLVFTSIEDLYNHVLKLLSSSSIKNQILGVYLLTTDLEQYIKEILDKDIEKTLRLLRSIRKIIFYSTDSNVIYNSLFIFTNLTLSIVCDQHPLLRKIIDNELLENFIIILKKNNKFNIYIEVVRVLMQLLSNKKYDKEIFNQILSNYRLFDVLYDKFVLYNVSSNKVHSLAVIDSYTTIMINLLNFLQKADIADQKQAYTTFKLSQLSTYYIEHKEFAKNSYILHQILKIEINLQSLVNISYLKFIPYVECFLNDIEYQYQSVKSDEEILVSYDICLLLSQQHSIDSSDDLKRVLFNLFNITLSSNRLINNKFIKLSVNGIFNLLNNTSGHDEDQYSNALQNVLFKLCNDNIYQQDNLLSISADLINNTTNENLDLLWEVYNKVSILEKFSSILFEVQNQDIDYILAFINYIFYVFYLVDSKKYHISNSLIKEILDKLPDLSILESINDQLLKDFESIKSKIDIK